MRWMLWLIGGVALIGCSTPTVPPQSSAGPGSSPPPHVLAQATATGPLIPATAPFAVPGGWDLTWSYDCAPDIDSQFYLSVYDETTHNIVVNLPGVRRRETSGSGTTHEADQPATRYLVVDSSCHWSVTATAPT